MLNLFQHLNIDRSRNKFGMTHQNNQNEYRKRIAKTHFGL